MELHSRELMTQNSASPRKLHRSHISKSLRGLKDSHAGSPVSTTGSCLAGSNTSLPQPRHQDTADSGESGWEVVDDLPLRWATDFVSLATPNSRLANSLPQFFKLWKNDTMGGRGTAMLAISTKTNILLYETPKGERAFRFVKVCMWSEGSTNTITHRSP